MRLIDILFRENAEEDVNGERLHSFYWRTEWTIR